MWKYNDLLKIKLVIYLLYIGIFVMFYFRRDGFKWYMKKARDDSVKWHLKKARDDSVEWHLKKARDDSVK